MGTQEVVLPCVQTVTVVKAPLTYPLPLFVVSVAQLPVELAQVLLSADVEEPLLLLALELELPPPPQASEKTKSKVAKASREAEATLDLSNVIDCHSLGH
jgi:hypothetical protein